MPADNPRAKLQLVSGATGFIGKRLYLKLFDEGEAVRALTRQATTTASDYQYVGDLSEPIILETACTGVDTIFHCAGYAHTFASSASNEAEKHWLINYEGTRNLLEAAGRMGVKRFVFLSSVKAMGDPGNACIDETHPGEPVTAYGKSKRAAEEAVLEAGKRYGMHVTNLRLAMVYGAGGRGNLERMARFVRSGYFPPLPETGNRRSLVHIDDVIRVMRLVAKEPHAAGKTYIIANSHAPSGRELYDALRSACGLPQKAWSVPAWSLKTLGYAGDYLERALGKRSMISSEVVDRLLSSACYSSSLIEQELGWRATVSLEDGLKEMLEE
ncbi:N-acetyl-alpha-D-glucosaminyl-diphospho-ditrans,octacis-undecaprenol 4-epimerase [compost metagenome]